MMTPDAFNAYLTWVCYAAVGQTAQSDALLLEHRDLVLEGAKAQREAFPIAPTTLYRGILLEGHEVFESDEGPIVRANERLRSVSYSEDLDVAQFFADPDSIMSWLVKSRKPSVRGYIIERRTVDTELVLFHHSWARTGIAMPPGMKPPWNGIKALPIGPPATVHLGEDLALQLMYALRTQREVILYQDGKPASIRPREDYPSPTTAQLNDRFVCPYARIPA